MAWQNNGDGEVESTDAGTQACSEDGGTCSHIYHMPLDLPVLTVLLDRIVAGMVCLPTGCVWVSPKSHPAGTMDRADCQPATPG